MHGAQVGCTAAEGESVPVSVGKYPGLAREQESFFPDLFLCNVGPKFLHGRSPLSLSSSCDGAFNAELTNGFRQEESGRRRTDCVGLGWFGSGHPEQHG